MGQIQAKAIIAAALIQSRVIDPEPLASLNKDISSYKLAHLRDLTERIYTILTGDLSNEADDFQFLRPSDICRA
jgi:hypothetical protein